jgi:S1-C subfamily serine protease
VPAWLPVAASGAPGGATGDGAGFAVTDARGHFSLHEVAEGEVVLEAYSPGVGRARSEVVTVTAGRTTDGVHLVVGPRPDDVAESGAGPVSGGVASGGVAVTLGETRAPTEVVVVSVVDGSEAEHAGLAPGDVVTAVDGAAVKTMEEARARLNGPIANDVLVAVSRGERAFALRVPREAVRR